jgi:hypothetical protein
MEALFLPLVLLIESRTALRAPWFVGAWLARPT